ncbi:MAG: insulinase family protein [Muribaculum sp.]|nr:insulinase family protein [Muribaculum sp.]
MKKYLINRLLCAVAVVMAMPMLINAQQMPPIPTDPNVRIGKLDNGLTYYIRHNEYPKGQADYFIAQKVGSIQEEDNQRGLAHFLEHMAFNGSKNFPDNSLVHWLETVGVKFGRNLNAGTGFDQTTYYFTQVPTARESVQDSCLLVLADWADGLLLEDAEIDKERGVIHEEWRSRNVGQQRLMEEALPIIYPGSKYADRMIIGTMEIVDNFPYQDLRDYYEKWYRPDLQGIVVVGDIDVDRIENKIKEIFSPIKMPANPAKREYYEVPDNEETIYYVGKDKELPNARVQLMFKSDTRPDSLKGTLDYMIENYAINMLMSMLGNRLDDMSNKPDAPFAAAGAYNGNYVYAKTKDAFTMVAIPKSGEVIPAFEAIYREALRAKRGGFTASEYDRARSEYLSRLENAYKNRNTITNTALAQEYVDNFHDNEPIPGIELEYQIMSMLSQQLSVEMLNAAMAELVPDNNTVVMVMLPDNGEYATPTNQELADAMKRVAAEDIEVYVDQVKTEPLIPQLPAPGKIVSTSKDEHWDATVWKLSNGATVIVKPTTFKDNEILFQAYAPGGTSMLSSDYDNILRVFDYVTSTSGLGDYTASDLNKYLAGKQAGVSFGFDSYDRVVSGSAVPKDLPTLMELIYMTFTDVTITQDEFDASKNTYAGVLQNQESEPQYQFSKQLLDYLYTSPRRHLGGVDLIKSADREQALDLIHRELSNPGEFTFIFVGNIDMEVFKPLVEQYIASMPGKAVEAVEVTPDPALSLRAGSGTEQVTYPMNTPQTWVAILATANLPYSSKYSKLASVAGQILTARLVKLVREDKGAVYSISASGSMTREPSLRNVVLQSAFPMKPEMKDEVLDIIAGQFDDMTNNISQEELDKVKEYMIKEATANLEKNGSWLSAMTAYQIKPVDGFTGAVEEINSITTDDVKKFMKEVMDQNNYQVFVMDPETK